jgi:hypothetical protein
MKTKFFALFALVGLSGLLAGCVGTVDGRSQAGVPFLKDRIEGQYNRTAPQVFAAAKKVLAANGTLTAENTINSSLEAKVDQASVFVKVDDIDSVKPIAGVIVQVRSKAGATDIDLAHDIEKKIALQLQAN